MNLVEIFVEHGLKFGGWYWMFWQGHQTVIFDPMLLIPFSVYSLLRQCRRGILFRAVEVVADLPKVVLEVS